MSLCLCLKDTLNSGNARSFSDMKPTIVLISINNAIFIFTKLRYCTRYKYRTYDKNKIYLVLVQILCYLLVIRVNERSATQIDATNNIYNTQSIIDE